jgi:hypothetical protein
VSTILRRKTDRPARSARFGRNGFGGVNGYVRVAMTYTFDIDARVARLCLHAGRLQAGV